MTRPRFVPARFRALAPALVALAAALLLVSPSVAPATNTDWRAALAAGAAGDAGAGLPADRKETIARSLAPIVSAPVTAELLDALAADARTRYPDGVRPGSSADAFAMLGSGGTDRDLAAGLQALLNKASAGAAAELRLRTLVDLLRLERTSVKATLSDAQVVGTTAADEEDLRTAGRHVGLAADAWQRGDPVAVVAQYSDALEAAWKVLARHGIAYTPGADRDGDGVPDLVEFNFGSNPLRGDTDGDGLTDGFEIRRAFPFHAPSDVDTDGDGTRDGAEDADGDGLDALDEQRLGSDPLRRDTDGEGLSDGREAELGTNPLRQDTDGDGLDDAAELRAGTDPLRADTDGDGIPDGSDVHTSEVTQQGVTVELTGSGDLAGSLTVRSLAHEPAFANAPGQAGAAFDLTLAAGAADGLQSAGLTLPYAGSFAGDPNDLKVFTLDPATQFWIPVDGQHQVDTAARTVTATVEHFSVYAVFDIRNWQQRWTAIGGTCKPRGGTGEPVYLDLVLTLDSSGSMSWNDPQGLRRTAAKSFVDALLEFDRSAVVDFDFSAILRQALTTNKVAVKAAIDRIDDFGGTDIGAGVRRALDELATVQDPTRAKLIVLLTDGVGAYSHTLTERASREQVTIYTIGLGFDVDAALLTQIAERTGGRYYPVASANDLPEVFRELEEDTGDSGQDTDGDGLTDCQETEGIRDAGGLIFTSDPRLVDTDGDGLDDGDEIGPGLPLSELPIIGGLFPPGTLYYNVFSDPQAVDSESDGLTDLEDLAAGARARSNETDGDGLSDFDEVRLGTDPSVVDTDGDGHWDGFEAQNVANGFDPLAFDEVYSGLDYVGQFANGFACFDIFGDLWGLCDGDTIPFLMGNVARGFFVITDIADAVGNLVHGDLYAAGLSVLGVIPFGGDALKFVDEVVAFARKGGPVARTTIELVMRMGDVPHGAKLRLLDAVYGASVKTLRDAGVSDDALIGLAKGRMDLDLIADVTRGAADVARRSPEVFTDPRAAEVYLRGLEPGYLDNGFRLHRSDDAVGAAGSRVADAYNPTLRAAKESKAGFIDGSRVLDEIDYDADLLDLNKLTDVEWHFFPSQVGDAIKFGPSQRVLDRLIERGIPYYVHLP